MNIELNKCYRTRDGRKARIICVDRVADYTIVALVAPNSPNCVESIEQYLPDVRKRVTDDSPLDLISEWVDKPEMDRSVLPPWIKCIAMDDNGRWYGYLENPIKEGDQWVAKRDRVGVCYIPPSHAPEWSGDWQDSLLVFED